MAGLKVSYGLISTRGHGEVLPDFPIINQFNHITAVVEVDNSTYLLDATEGKRSVTLIPEKDLYRYAFVIRENSNGWLQVSHRVNSTRRLILNYSIKGDGSLQGQLAGLVSGYLGQDLREEVNSADEEDALTSYLGGTEDLEVSNIKLSNVDDMDKEVRLSASFTYQEAGADTTNDIIYLNPWLFLKRSGNPLKKPDREFPVFFSHPYTEQLILNIRIPEGYIVDELPEQVSYNVPGGASQVRLLVQANGNLLTLSTQFVLNKATFKVNEYEGLRTLFQKMADIHSKPIVLKKES